MRSRVWGLLGLYVGLAGCSASSGADDTGAPVTGGGFGGFGGTVQNGGGGTVTAGGGGVTPLGGFGGSAAAPLGGSSGTMQGGTSGVAGAGNFPNTGGTPPMNVCGTV